MGPPKANPNRNTAGADVSLRASRPDAGAQEDGGCALRAYSESSRATRPSIMPFLGGQSLEWDQELDRWGAKPARFPRRKGPAHRAGLGGPH